MHHKSPILSPKGVQANITKLLPNALEKAYKLAIKKGGHFHGSLIKSIAFPQKLLKKTPIEQIKYPVELPIKFRNR
jgi:hypothetical protein